MNPSRLGALAALIALAGCKDRSETPAIEYLTVRDAIDLGATAYDDPLPSGTWSLANAGGLTLLVSTLGLEGEGADYLDLSGVADYTEVPPEDTVTFTVSLADDREAWDGGDYAVSLNVEIGAFYDDPRTWSRDPSWTAEEVAVPITFSLLCDLDGDGLEAADCGGEDCNDADAGIAAWSEEVCDGTDNDCDGEVDEDDAVDATSWYRDRDGDGYGVEDDAVTACEPPSGYVAEAGDCDDATVNVAPGTVETDDGRDEDCDGLVDETFVDVGDLVITELMVDPAGSDRGGEWFEVLNASSRDLDLSGWLFEVDDGAADPVAFAVSPDAGVVLAPGGIALFCQDADALLARAPQLDCAYAYGVADNGFADGPTGPAADDGWVLPGSGTLTVDMDGSPIDTVSWDAEAWGVGEGASLALDPDAADVASNDDPANWCAGASAYDGENLGSPGEANPDCAGAR